MAPPKLNRKCSILDCGRKHLAHGLCAMHLRRQRLYGDPATVQLVQLHGLTFRQRWEAYTPRSDGCWEWTGARDSNGYGRLNIDGKPVLAHRLAWQLHRGPITSEDHICHKCDNPPCVNPSHLFKGNAQMNSDDKLKKKRHRYGVSKGEAHGHAILTEEQAREIKASALSHKACAERFGVSYQTVWEIRKGVSWKHI